MYRSAPAASSQAWDSSDWSRSTFNQSNTSAPYSADFGAPVSDLQNSCTGSGDSPAYNPNNLSCRDTTSMDGSAISAAVDRDKVVSSLNRMFTDNEVMCDECFGQSKSSCQSRNTACTKGLQDLAVDGEISKRDRAAVHFAKNAYISDITCRFESHTCATPPNCDACEGIGAWAVLKSITTQHNSLELVWKAIG